MTMALFYLAKPTTGGWPTYTAHLAKGIGSNTTIFKIGKRNETFPRRFGRGLSYQNVTIEQAIAIAATFPSVVTATDKHYQEYSHRLISETNCPAVVHDPTELKLAHIETLGPTVVIRESMLHHLPKARFIKHPYMRCPDFGETDQKRAGGVAISRVDYDKRTHMIAEANQMQTFQSTERRTGYTPTTNSTTRYRNGEKCIKEGSQLATFGLGRGYAGTTNQWLICR
jgi:hypothetical protein